MGGPPVGYNSLENPIGIETTSEPQSSAIFLMSYNSLENPIGIETRYHGQTHKMGHELQLIRKPDRD